MEAIKDVFCVGQHVSDVSKTFVHEHYVAPQSESIQEQINRFSRHRMQLRELGTEWSQLGRLLKQSKKMQRREFKRLVRESQIELDL